MQGLNASPHKKMKHKAQVNTSEEQKLHTRVWQSQIITGRTSYVKCSLDVGTGQARANIEHCRLVAAGRPSSTQ